MICSLYKQITVLCIFTKQDRNKRRNFTISCTWMHWKSKNMCMTVTIQICTMQSLLIYLNP